MSFLTSTQLPESLDDEVAEYLARIFTILEIDIGNSDVLPIKTDQTVKPKEGKLYYFKNASTTVPAIDSAGYWGFVGEPNVGIWVKLG